MLLCVFFSARIFKVSPQSFSMYSISSRLLSDLKFHRLLYFCELSGKIPLLLFPFLDPDEDLKETTGLDTRDVSSGFLVLPIVFMFFD